MSSKEQESSEDTFLAPKLPFRKPRGAEAPSKESSKETPVQTNPQVVVDDYIPPSWAEVPPSSSDHFVEVMKSGVLKKTVRLRDLAAKKSYVTVGRAEVCDIKTGLAESSRIHCYLQYGEAFDGRGWYVIDKGSLHKTYVNKQELPRNVYYRAKSGSMIQLTKNNFHLFLNGTDEASERVVEQQSTEVKPVQAPIQSTEKRSHSEKDPLGTLKEFCDREGMDMTFDKEVKNNNGTKEVTCSFELPDNICAGEGGVFTGLGSTVEVAQKECARKVCIHLESLGMLQTILWNKEKNLQENDFYDDDEDTFYDRTGQIEQQREKRIQRHNAEFGIEEKALTHDEVLTKLSALEETKTTIACQIEKIIKPLAGSNVNPEKVNLSSLNASLSVRMEISRLKKKLAEINKEYEVMSKAEVASRPTQVKLAPTKPKPTESKTLVAQPKVVQEEEPVVHDDTPSTSNTVQMEIDEIEDVRKPKEVEIVKTVDVPPPVKEPKKNQLIGKDGKKYGLLSRSELQSQEANVKNKRKVQQDFLDEIEKVEEKRNKTETVKETEEPVWVPPQNQTGDGRTSLNDKLGY